MKTLACLLLLAATSVAAPPASLAEKIDRAIDASPPSRAAFWGIQMVDLATGETLYEANPNRFFVPASNTKLFSTALALTRLGADHRFATTVLADSAPDSQGTVRGPLRLVGGGDPNLSARSLPYRMGPITGNPLAAIEDLATQVASHGVKRVEGDIIGDDTWYVWEPYPGGWGIDDPQFEYGAPVSALTLNDNAFSLRLRPGAREGDPAVMAITPAGEYYAIDNRVRTIASGERRIRVDRDPGGAQLRLWGVIPLRDRGEEMLLGIEEPARYAAAALRSALAARGIAVTGGVRAEHLFPNQLADPKLGPSPVSPPAGIELARRLSAPLGLDLQVTDKVSQNLHAELALRSVGRARRNLGSREAGLEELGLFLDEAGIPRTEYHIVDGSGLARLNLVTAATMVKLLRHMYGQPGRDTWMALLPIGGQDGTLSSRMGSGPALGRVHAKTGSLSHVAALSGYAERVGGGWVAFSILVNNFNAPASEIRGVMDRICNLMVE